jgi:hypothetical protein
MLLLAKATPAIRVLILLMKSRMKWYAVVTAAPYAALSLLADLLLNWA